MTTIENDGKKGPIVEMTRPEEEKDPQGDVQLLPEDVPAWIQALEANDRADGPIIEIHDTIDQAAHPEIDAHGDKKRIEILKGMGL